MSKKDKRLTAVFEFDSDKLTEEQIEDYLKESIHHVDYIELTDATEHP